MLTAWPVRVRIIHTNTVEGFYSVFKRGMKGIYQHCSEGHLHRYVAEFDFRYNTRIRLGMDDIAGTNRALKGIVGKRLRTGQLVGQGQLRIGRRSVGLDRREGSFIADPRQTELPFTPIPMRMVKGWATGGAATPLPSASTALQGLVWHHTRNGRGCHDESEAQGKDGGSGLLRRGIYSVCEVANLRWQRHV